MPHYAANTDELRDAAKRLESQRESLLAALQRADGVMLPLRQVRSPRISQDIEEWDTVRRRLVDVLNDEIEHAVDLLSRTASDSDAVFS